MGRAQRNPSKAEHRTLPHNAPRFQACGRPSFKAKRSPACGRRGPFHGGKGPKTPRAGRTSVRLLPHRSAALLGKRRPAPNSHVHVLQTPAPFPCGCLRCSPCSTARCRTRPRIHALRPGLSVLSHGYNAFVCCGELDSVRKGASPESRSEEHTSELQSLMRISYAVFCLKKKRNNTKHK